MARQQKPPKQQAAPRIILNGSLSLACHLKQARDAQVRVVAFLTPVPETNLATGLKPGQVKRNVDQLGTKLPTILVRVMTTRDVFVISLGQVRQTAFRKEVQLQPQHLRLHQHQRLHPLLPPHLLPHQLLPPHPMILFGTRI